MNYTKYRRVLSPSYNTRLKNKISFIKSVLIKTRKGRGERVYFKLVKMYFLNENVCSSADFYIQLELLNFPPFLL